MNEALNREFFNTLGNTEIANFIEQANEIVVLAIPSLSVKIAESLTKAEASSLHVVFSKEDPSNSRTPEHADAIELLAKNGIILRMSDSFSIGTLVVDQKGWLFTPLVEANTSVNSYAVSKDEAQKLVNSLAAVIVNRVVEPSSQPELGEKLLNKDVAEDLKAEQKVLIEKEKVNHLYEVAIEFVELKFKGIRIGSKRISIPKELTVLGMDDEVKEILTSSAKLFTKNHDFSKKLKKLEDKLSLLKKDFLINIPDYGIVINKHIKDKFNSALEELRKDAEETKVSIFGALSKELEETKKALFAYYTPIIKKSPPNSLLKRHNLFDDNTVEDYLEGLFWTKFPLVDKLVDEIELLCRFKGVTIELMNDEKFQKELGRQGIEL